MGFKICRWKSIRHRKCMGIVNVGMVYYNKTNTCDRCGKILIPGYPCREYNKEGDWTGGWLCSTCYRKDREENDNTTNSNLRKMLTSKINDMNMKSRRCCKCKKNETYTKPDGGKLWRSCTCGKENCTKWLCDRCRSRNIYISLGKNGLLGRFSNRGKEVIGQWITAKTFNLEDLNIKNDNFSEPIDLSYHEILGRSDVKTASMIGDVWTFSHTDRECDTLALLCMDDEEPWRNILRVYIVPYDKVSWSHIYIYEDWSKVRGGSEFEILDVYRVDEKPFNDMYHTIEIPEFFNPFDLWKGIYDKKK